MKDEVWDVCVVGGGPAGLMAAGRAAALGAQVVLIEKNASLGKKLLITGGGRCNVTNTELTDKHHLERYKTAAKYLPSPFSQWDSDSTLRFFNDRGMPTKVENEGRVFPVSNTAQSVLDVLAAYIKAGRVVVVAHAPVAKIVHDADLIEKVILQNKREIRAKSFIFATGGKSHPETGSTGDGFGWLKDLGHTVNDANAALVPVALKDTWVKRVAGVSIKEAKITLYQGTLKYGSRLGKVLFTHVGLSGPGILNASRDIGELLKYGPVEIELDLCPKLGYEKVNERLQALFKEHTNKKVRNSLGDLLTSALVPIVLERAEINPETPCNSVKRAERVHLMKALKHLRMEVKNLLGLEKAVVTAGGVALDEIDWKTMRSMKYKNLYIIGDLLDIDRPSGGYSLQLCWTTGFVAGSAAAESK